MGCGKEHTKEAMKKASVLGYEGSKKVVQYMCGACMKTKTIKE